MGIFDRKFREILSFQIVSIFGGLIAGTLLAVYTNNLFILPGMLILLPGFLEMRGNISGSLAARLTSGMFLGAVNPRRMKTKIVKGNVLASFLLAVTISAVLGVIAFAFNLIIFGVFVPVIILVPLIAGILANIIEIPLTLFFTFYLFRKGHDPDNIMGPFVTTTGDIVSIIALLLVMVVLV